MLRNVYRRVFFKDDDDNTPQGKLARGTFYVFYVFLAFMFLFGLVTPTIDYFCGGCWHETRKAHP